MEPNTKRIGGFSRRWCYFLVVLVIVVPIIVGVVVWHLTKSACAESRTEDGTSSTLPVHVSEDPQISTTVEMPIQTTFSDDEQEDEPWKNLRLPSYVYPIHYDITLYPDFYGSNGWFYGNETVELNVTSFTRVLLIHANFLNITRTSVRYGDGELIGISRTFWYEENQFWVVETILDIMPSVVYLDLEFDGSLTRAIVGFYKSSYINSITKEERHLASSKFQPVDARRAFPCFDEPHIKAEYTITLVHQPGYIALSNMPAKLNEVETLRKYCRSKANIAGHILNRTEFERHDCQVYGVQYYTDTETWQHNSSLLATRFDRSVAMSTYLVCFVVCDFANLTGTTDHGTTIRVFATPDRIQQAQYSLRVMKVSMDVFQDLFNVPFPLPKNDMIAIPNFVSGAMEHWGLITYREVNMLFDEHMASASDKQRVAVVVAHEIAHMWFGNIVTMDWWDDLWLNEGFASFVEYIGVDAVEPEWEMMDQMIINDVKPVMITDAGVKSHPIVVPVYHPDQITEVFDAISYSKGASVIRMLQEIVGSDAFFKGISTYLTKYEWATATTDDLWSELKMVPGGYSVKEVMDTWTRQMGLPVIDITFTNSGDGNVTRVTANQQRFLVDKNIPYNVSESPYGYKWFVYLDFVEDTKYRVEWMTKDEQTITFDIEVDMSASTSLIKFNVNETGFYRVNYPESIWLRFATLLQAQGPTAVRFPADRTGLVDNAFNLARGGYLSYNVALEMTKYLDKELHLLPWKSAHSGIIYMTNMFRTSANFDYLRKYFLTKVRPVLNHLTWEDGTSHLDKILRTYVIELACEFADPDCLGNATQKFRNWIERNETVSPNIRYYVYKYGMMASGTQADWDYMWHKYEVETVPQERVKLLYGLAKTKHVWLLNRYLEYAKDPNKIRSQDFFTVINFISRNPVGTSLAWDWVRINYDYLLERFTAGSRSLGRLVPYIVNHFNTDFKLKEVEDFFTQYPDAGAGARGREQALENIRQNIAWMKNNADVIVDWLKREI